MRTGSIRQRLLACGLASRSCAGGASADHFVWYLLTLLLFKQ
jgi:hypothetical protein